MTRVLLTLALRASFAVRSGILPSQSAPGHHSKLEETDIDAQLMGDNW